MIALRKSLSFTPFHSILMAVDVLDKGKTVKEVVKNAQHYVPNETYSNPAKKFFLHSKASTELQSVMSKLFRL